MNRFTRLVSERLSVTIICALLCLPSCITTPRVAGDVNLDVSADSAAAILAALSAYETPNGPIIEVARSLVCAHSRSTCSAGSADTVLQAFANRHEARFVTDEEPQPACRWTTEAPEPRGLRIQASQLRDEEGIFSVSIKTMCTARRSGRASAFYHAITYQLEETGGRWRVVKILDEVIT